MNVVYMYMYIYIYYYSSEHGRKKESRKELYFGAEGVLYWIIYVLAS
jgi:hypothetical protein